MSADDEGNHSESSSSSRQSAALLHNNSPHKGPQPIQSAAATSATTTMDMERAPLTKSLSTSILGRFQKDRRSLLFFGKQHRSAVHRRNHQFVQDDWEMQAAPRSVLVRASSSILSSPTTTTTTTAANTPRETYHTTTASNKSAVVASILKQQRKRDRRAFQQQAAMCTDGLDCRLTADHVAVLLDVGDDAASLLHRLRGRAGAVEMEPAATTGDAKDTNGVPYLHLSGDVWIPHYEEYVVRSVEAFTQFLRTPSLSGRK